MSKVSGFTLVELIVSVGIASLLMVGLSVFFAGTFRNMFTAREQVTNSQSTFVVNTILNEKFRSAEKVLQNNGTSAVIQNNLTSGELPFTYIGEDNGRLVMKDLFVFTEPTPDVLPSISGAEMLVDMTDNGESNPALRAEYITDAKAGVVYAKIGASAPVPINSDLNFPTGIALDKANNMLFVSETGSNRIVKMETAGNILGTVVGGGEDEDCGSGADSRDHTALYCKLNYPTGLLIAGTPPALYISDTGNGRVLKVSDPSPDLSNVEFQLDLGSTPTQVSKVEFELPGATNLDQIVESDPNVLHNGVITTGSSVVEKALNAPMIQIYTEDECINKECNATITRLKGFDVLPENDIFQAGDTIKIKEDIFTVDSVSDIGGGNKRVMVSPDNRVRTYSNGQNVIIQNTFSGSNIFQFNLENVTIPPGFNTFTTTAFDEDDDPINDPPNYTYLRIGDGQIGTPEDIISVVDNYNYPTGLGWGSDLEVSEGGNITPSDIDEYDYTSEFKLDENLDFEQNGNVLDLRFTAILGETLDGEDTVPITEDFQLSASVKP
jgi:type II secretory pathway pseudopilin PulG